MNNVIFPHTELGIDLKLLRRTPGRMAVGASIGGMITHDEEDHFTFIQNDTSRMVDATPRNPHVYQGQHINVNRRNDGTIYPTFNRPQFNKGFTFKDFCRLAAKELYYVAGLVEEGDGAGR